MKDYSTKIKDNETFILNYNIEKDEIVVNLASGKNYKVPNTPDNENEILQIMKNQVLNSSGFKKAQKFIIPIEAISILVSIFLIALSARNIHYTTIPVIDAINVVCIVWFTAVISFCSLDILGNTNILKDIKKNKMFLENEELIKTKVKSKKDVLEKVDEKTKEIIESSPEKRPVLTLNDLDSISYEELEKIIECLGEEEEKSNQTNQEENSIQLTKKRK